MASIRSVQENGKIEKNCVTWVVVDKAYVNAGRHQLVLREKNVARKADIKRRMASRSEVYCDFYIRLASFEHLNWNHPSRIYIKCIQHHRHVYVFKGKNYLGRRFQIRVKALNF